MSNSSKIAIGVVVIVVIGFVAWWYMGSDTSVSTPVTSTAYQQQNETASASAAASAVIPVTGLSTSAKDSSDAALDKDLSTVNTQIDAFAADNAAANSSSAASAQ
jgi:predicted negative regulator of RcsB-dependent stress response